MSLPLTPPPTLYDAGQCLNGHTDAAMQAYGQACRADALKEAAALCNGEQWMMSGKKSIDYITAFNEGCADCESVIKRLK